MEDRYSEDRPRYNYFSSAELDVVQRNAIEKSALKSIGGAILVSLLIGFVCFILFGG
jgi:hypothetical protein